MSTNTKTATEMHGRRLVIAMPIRKRIVQAIPRVGQPAKEIALLVKKRKFDLLMIGSHGHGALSNLILGSVATRVLASCVMPVLIVR